MNYEIFLTLCKQNHITQTALLKKLDINQSNIYNWKKGSTINSNHLIQIAKFFNVTTDYLLGLSQPPHIHNENIRSGDIIYSPQSNNAINIQNNELKELSEIENEIINICKNLSIKQKTEILYYAYKIEQGKQGE